MRRIFTAQKLKNKGERKVTKAKNKGYSTGKLILLSFGIAAVAIIWCIYDSYVPLIIDQKLNELSLSALAVSTLTGAIMTIDNIFAVIFQPIFGNKSDHTRSKYGKRMPFLIIGIPISAFLFALIPIVAKSFEGVLSIVVLMTVIIVFNFMMSVWRSPCVALMPDMVPTEYQSDGNAVVNLMSYAAYMIAAMSATIMGIAGFEDAIAAGDYTSVFIFSACLTVLCLVVLMTCLKWKDNRKDAIEKSEEKAEKKNSIFKLALPADVKKSLYFMMIFLFCHSAATEGIQTFFTLYATKTLGISVADATMSSLGGLIAGIILAVPAGVWGRKFGRRKTITIGIILNCIAYLAMSMIVLLPQETRFIALVAVSVINASAGIAVTINTLPIMLTIGGRENFGTFTGYYYSATMLAATIAPTILGFLCGFTGYNMIYAVGIAILVISVILLRKVNHGEKLSEEEEAELAAGIE